MSSLFFLFAYGAIAVSLVIALCKIRHYLGNPAHVRWELYPVAHEGKKASYGGSFMEETDWWTKSRHTSLVGELKGFLMEALFLHATFEHNIKLWLRTYPFHFGIYMLFGGVFLTVITTVAQIAGIAPGGMMHFFARVVNAISLFGLLGILGGSIALIMRRRNDPGLRKYTSNEHYLNLGLFALFAVLGLLAWTCSSQSFHALTQAFFNSLFTFKFAPSASCFFMLHVLVGLLLIMWIPVGHMGHVFMKYFTYHDIRWGDEPTVYSDKFKKAIGKALQYPVSWSAPHIKGEGKKTWVDIATTNPAKPKED